MGRFSQVISKRMLMALSLFLIGALHTMIFAIFQFPENFLLGHTSPDLAFVCKIILYSCTVIVSLSHQAICKWVGLRKALYLGLLCNLLGITTLMMNQLLGDKGLLSLVFLDMIFFGIALPSVINSLVTYTVLEFPKKVGFGVIALFAFLNLGNMLAPILLDVFRALKLGNLVYPFLIALIWLSIWFVHIYFFDPSVPQRAAYLKKGSLIWRELHYRLGLFVFALFTYSLTESTFNLWGFIQIQNVLGTDVASETIPFFWLFMILGQVLLLLPLYFFSPLRIFYALILIIIGAAFYFPIQTTVGGFIISLVAAGIGCSAIFPILLSMMGRELSHLAKGGLLLHYIEVGISVMIAAYFFGIGTVDIWVQKWGAHPQFYLPGHFYVAAVFISITGLVTLFLHITAPKYK